MFYLGGCRCVPRVPVEVRGGWLYRKVLGLSLHHVASRDRAQIVELGCRCFTH